MRGRELLDLIDEAPIGRPYKLLALGIMLGAVLEFFDFFLIAFVVPVLRDDWNLTYGQASAILLAAGLGAILGAVVWGRLGDRFGRQPPLVGGILAFSLGTGALALAPEGGWWYLALLRFVVGIGVGGLGAVAVPLLVEFTPTRLRSKLIGLITTSMIPIAVIFAGLSVAVFEPLVGWRPLFAAGVLPAFLALYVRVACPESPRWLLERGREAEARAVVAWLLERPADGLPGPQPAEPARLEPPSPRLERIARLTGVPPAPRIAREVVRAAPAPRSAPGGEAQAEAQGRPLLSYRRNVAATALAWFGGGAVAGSIVLWGPTFLETLLEIDSDEAALLFVIVTLGAFAGRISFSLLPARIGRRPAGMLMGFGCIPALLVAALAEDSALAGVSIFLLALIVAAFFADGGLANLVPWTPETFPTHVRAQAAGLGQAINGLGRLVGPAVLGAIAGTSNVIEPEATADALLPSFAFLAGCSLLVGIAFAVLATETHGKDLETLASELAHSGHGPHPDHAAVAPQPSGRSAV